MKILLTLFVFAPAAALAHTGAETGIASIAHQLSLHHFGPGLLIGCMLAATLFALKKYFRA